MKLILPLPPGTNNLYFNVPNRGRVISGTYQRWRKVAEDTLWNTKITRFLVPVDVHIRIEDKGRRDIDGFAKPLLDFLVRASVVEDDSRKYIRRLTMEWADIEGCEMEVTPHGD
jgi:crossover junction endodeoxyribonuclease RusA